MMTPTAPSRSHMRAQSAAAVLASCLWAFGASAQTPEAGDHYRAGHALLQSKDYRNAAIELESAVGADSTYADAHYGLGMSRYYLGDYGKSATAFEAALRHGLTPVNLAQRVPGLLADIHYKAGLHSKQQHRFGEAIQHFEASLRHRPDNAQAYYTIGLCRLSLRQPGKAEPAMRAAIAADATYPWPYKSLGDIHRDRGELQKATQMYEKAISVDAEIVHAYSGLARVRLASEDLEGAVTTLRKAVTIDATYAEGFVLLGTALNRLQRFGEAVDALGMATALERGNAEARYRLAEAHLGTGDFRSAVDAGKAAVGKRKDFYAAMVVLADAYEHLGQTDEARTWYQRAKVDSRFRDYCTHKLRELDRAQASTEGR